MAGFVHRVTGSDNWRFMLSGAGVTLGLLPLGQGQWRAAFGAAVVGLLVVGAWAWGTRSSRSVGMAGGASLVGLMVVVFAVSQWPTGLITAPPCEWLGGWLSIGAGCLAALVVDWVVHRSRLRRVAPSPALASMWRWRVAVSVLATVWLVCGCGVAAVVGDGDGALRFSASDDEVLPLPTALRLVSVDHCASGGSRQLHGRVRGGSHRCRRPLDRGGPARRSPAPPRMAPPTRPRDIRR